MPIDFWPKTWNIEVLSDKENFQLSSLNLDYHASASLKKSPVKKGALILELVLRRKIAPSIIEIIAPSGLLVLVAWVLLSVLIISKLDKITFQNLSVYFQISFLLPVDSVPGRMGFLLTLFLCTVNILSSMATSTPKSGGVTTAIIQWILWCLMFIIIPILE